MSQGLSQCDVDNVINESETESESETDNKQ